ALEVGLGRRGGALGRGPQLLLRPLLACRGLAQLGRQQVTLALPLAHLRGPACRRGLGLREARPELLELRRALGRIGLPLLAQRGDPALQLGNLCARLHVAEAGLLQPLLEAPALGEQRARALLQLGDLVARALLLVLERLDCALGAGERGAGALGLRVRCSACLLGGPGSGQRPLEVVLVYRRRALAGGAGERERRGGRRCRRRRAPAGGLDHARQLAQRLGERADLLLGDPLWGDRDQDDARDRCRAGVERHAGDGRDRGGRLDQRRYVAVLGRALDQVDAAVEQAVERHVPSGHAAAAYLAQALAA